MSRFGVAAVAALVLSVACDVDFGSVGRKPAQTLSPGPDFPSIDEDTTNIKDPTVATGGSQMDSGDGDGDATGSLGGAASTGGGTGTGGGGFPGFGGQGGANLGGVGSH